MSKYTFGALLGFVISCATPVSWAAEPTEAEYQVALKNLIEKDFHITTRNGKKSMVAISSHQAKALSSKGYGQQCSDNIARLNVAPGRDAAAVLIKGTPLILAFLDCPANNDGGAESIAALFDYRNTSAPQCFTHIDLMNKPDYYWWGMVHSLALRKITESEYFVAVTLSGGDAGDSWTSYAFLHINSQCQLTPVATFYESRHVEVPDAKNCEGNIIDYRFVTDSTVEIKTKRLICTATGHRTEPIGTRSYNLREMLRDPKLRVFEPE